MDRIWRRPGMPGFTIRNFTPADIPQVVALQQAYRQAYPYAAVIPGEVYLSAGFEDGKNIFCAFDEEQNLLGYAPLFPSLTDDPRLPHTVWAEVKADPQLASAVRVKDRLFERVLERARQIGQAVPGHATRLTFQYHPSETSSIDYVTARGCASSESVFRMLRDLAQPLPEPPPPGGVEVRRWRMQSEAEQQAYVQARNQAFPEAPVALADWQYFLSSPAWQEGAAITAFDGPQIAGSVTVYWDDTLQQATGKEAGFTEYIFVREKWRRRGIASYLIVQGMQYLKEHGREAAFLEVKAENQSALGLYQRLGYQVVDETRFFVHVLE
jgi:ribosomal protein S18 acetylase RimI-like enzyme